MWMALQTISSVCSNTLYPVKTKIDVGRCNFYVCQPILIIFWQKCCKERTISDSRFISHLSLLVGYVCTSVNASCCQARSGWHFFFHLYSSSAHGACSTVQQLQCRTLNFFLNCGPTNNPKLNSKWLPGVHYQIYWVIQYYYNHLTASFPGQPG